jgi:hypothetical protein
MSQATLKSGATGAAVKELTALLVKRGYLDKASSTFDATVRAAVLGFQARHVDERGEPLVADGVVGPLTWWALGNTKNPAVLSVPVVGDLAKLPSSGGSPRGRAALKVALGEMAAGACEQGGNNTGPWVKKYLNDVVPAPNNWCAGFVSWCYAQHPEGVPFKYSVGARNVRDQFRAKGWAYDLASGTVPEPGDIIVWWRGQPSGWMGHIGLVHHSANGIVYTIEGNKGEFPSHVRSFNYVLSRIEQLLGFGRVPF